MQILNKILPQVEFAIPRPSFNSLSHNKLVKKILSVFNLKLTTFLIRILDAR
ncbi:Type III secretion system effector protein IpgB1 (plasmid) [Shigella dysenteriae WRSd3]|uniref:Type III secretion system effector protein IpgB1 n=1 Tax=Shigella dysenteriae WRSd3 TaxID=1401327 RepID=A0A090N9H4_SHIDY|nr:Type III secretion system effector protein IpgB1 [Shigella dysenteriae WRSd3]